MFPNIDHKPCIADIFDESLSYEVAEGSIEVNTLFGLTRDNVEGLIKDGPPKKAYLDMTHTILKQMSPGAHFITTTDVNQNAEEIEDCYKDQTDFALNMLSNRGIDASNFSFHVEFDKETHILAHYFQVENDVSFSTKDGEKTLLKGERYHFNTSLKLPLDKKLKWEQEAGFKVLDTEQSISLDGTGRMALIHLQK